MMPDPRRLPHKIRGRLRARSLGGRPTPLTAASAALTRSMGLDALWVKREDAIGGNKVRSLEFLLAAAQVGDVVLTIGGSGASHRPATAGHPPAPGCPGALPPVSPPHTDTALAPPPAPAPHADIASRSP